jgi:hypothetical protein
MLLYCGGGAEKSRIKARLVSPKDLCEASGSYILGNIVKRLARICLFESVCFAVLSQTGPVPARWTGAWALNVQKSTLGEILIPGVPVDLKIIRQTVRIEQAATDIRISGDTVVSDGNGSHSNHEDNRLKFDGTATIIGPVSLSFRRIDDFAFDIISALDIPDHNVGEVSRFVFSPDGRSLTETKTQTEREVVAEGTDKSSGAVIKTSKAVLVFAKIPSR